MRSTHPFLTSFGFLALVLSVGTADAQIQSKEQQGCIVGVNRAVAKLATSVAGEATACLKAGEKGRLAGNTAAECMDIDGRDKVAKAAAKVESEAIKRCLGTPPLFGFDDAASAVGAQDQISALITDIFGEAFLNAEPLSHLGAAKCRSTVAKDLTKVIGAMFDAFGRCKKDGLANATVDSQANLEACFGDITADARGKIGKAITKLMLDVSSKCGDDYATLFGGECALAPGVLSVGTCSKRLALCRTCLAINEADALSLDCETLDDGLLNLSCPPGQVPPTTTTTIPTTTTSSSTTTSTTTSSTTTTTLGTTTTTTTLDTTTTTIDTTTTTSTTTTSTTTSTTTTTTIACGVITRVFSNTCADVTVNAPLITVIDPEASPIQRIVGTGSFTLEIDTCSTADADMNGLDEMTMQIVDVTFAASDPGSGANFALGLETPPGPVLPAHTLQERRSLGTIEETVNNTPGILDLPPYAASGSATINVNFFLTADVSVTDPFPLSFNDLHTHTPADSPAGIGPLQLSGTISGDPPGLDEFVTMQNPAPVAIVTSAEADFQGTTVDAVMVTFNPTSCTVPTTTTTMP